MSLKWTGGVRSPTYNGLNYPVTTVEYLVVAGGGSGGAGLGGVGGAGGGGVGGTSRTAGSANTGGGGGGACNSTQNTGGAGGSGIVIIRFPSTFADAASVTNGTKTTANGYTIYTFTSSGSITL